MDNVNRTYRYLKFQVSTEVALTIMRKKILTKHIPTYIKIEYLNPETDSESLAEVYNRTFLVAADPYAPIGLKEVTAVGSEGIIVAKMFNKIVGFAYLKIRIEKSQKVGEIAIVGVIPEKRKQGIATALSVKIAEHFLKRRVELLECEVYENNKPSLAYILAFGFEYVGERLAKVVEDEILDEAGEKKDKIKTSEKKRRPKLYK
ncbi:MAG: GNAT family N-acetyltransferase [Promethearchaeota archaeon]